MMAHHDRSIHVRVITLAEEVGCASIAGELYSVLKSTAGAWLQKYLRDGQVQRHRGTGLWHVTSPAQDSALVAKAQTNPFISARDFKTATGFHGQKRMFILRLKEAGFRTRPIAVQELLTDEHKLYLFFHSRTMHLDIIKVFYLPTDAQENCFKKNTQKYHNQCSVKIKVSQPKV
jgi:hypothetical protein